MVVGGGVEIACLYFFFILYKKLDNEKYDKTYLVDNKTSYTYS